MPIAPITLLGGSSRGGTYLLHVTVERPLTVTFGRFQQGWPIPVPAGRYLYVGSALADKGSASLARRMLRHATRTGERPFHPIRAAMLTTFPAIGLADAPLRPPAHKTLRWHVDYLLECADAALTHVTILRSPRRLEPAVARLLAADDVTTPLAAGLGAGDSRGETHLLRIDADSTWWQSLPMRLLTRLHTIE